MAQALVEAKTEIDNEQCQDTVKREEQKTNKEKKQQTYEPLWRFTWVKTHVQRYDGQRAHRFAKRCERYVEKKLVLMGSDDLCDVFFNIFPIQNIPRNQQIEYSGRDL